MFVASGSAICLVLVSCLLIASEFTAATDYCKISKCAPRRHTMCIYSDTKQSSSKCHNYVAAPLTASESAALVKKHNELRKKVADGKETRGAPGPQPPASDMKEMKWDGELARISQRWADQCMSGHDECRHVGRFVGDNFAGLTSTVYSFGKISEQVMRDRVSVADGTMNIAERFKVGQNIASRWSTAQLKMPVQDLVDGWYNEVEIFSKDIVDQFRSGSGYGHYTQLVWGNSSYLGCGRVRFFDRGRKMNAVQLICNYGPTGNFLDHPMYTKGKAGSACPSGASKRIPSLCN